MDEIQQLVSGFRRFQHKYFGEHGLFEQLKQRQQPRVLVIGCTDSRVTPELLTDCDPGELFVVRNIANLVPPFEPDSSRHGISSAIEYAVCDLQVRRIIVLGHSNCGGIAALVKGREARSETDFVGRWMSIAAPVRDRIISELHDRPLIEQIHACELASIVASIENLKTFPFVAQRLAAGEIGLIGWYFDIGEGSLSGLDQRSGRFSQLARPPRRYGDDHS
jgi:carbonic anhydrase